jgi:hypothetical protein
MNFIPFQTPQLKMLKRICTTLKAEPQKILNWAWTWERQTYTKNLNEIRFIELGDGQFYKGNNKQK